MSINYPPEFMLNAESVTKLRTSSFLGTPLYVFDEVTSTFDKISEYPRQEGLTVASRKQTSGRGRLGRSWDSGQGGIYFSFNLTPKSSPEEATFATITCALGVVKALKKYGNCAIKWPNDIVMNGKKICGILTTMTVSGNILEYICVGIGININKDSFPKNLPHASSIRLETGMAHNENEILTSVLNSIEEVYTTYSKEKTLEEYTKNCITVNKTVTVHFADNRNDFEGICKKIDENGSLVVQCGDKTVTVNSGEVSVRGLYGYV